MRMRRIFTNKFGFALALVAVVTMLFVIALPEVHAIGDPGHDATRCQLCIIMSTGAIQFAAIASVGLLIVLLIGFLRFLRVSVDVLAERPQLSRGPPL